MHLYIPQSQEENMSIAGIAGAQLGITFAPPFIALASIDDNGIIGGIVIFNNYDGANIDITAVGKGAWSPRVVRDICRYVFNQLGCARITAKVRKNDRKTRKLLNKHSYFETGLRDWFGVGRHGVQYRMTRDECRFLGKKNGIEPVISRAA